MALVERATSPAAATHLRHAQQACPISLRSAQPQPPTLIIVGSVVRLAEQLRWYGSG
jgi:siroheme synthase